MKKQNLLAIIAVLSTSYIFFACGKNPAFKVVDGSNTIIDQAPATSNPADGTNPSDQKDQKSAKNNKPNKPTNTTARPQLPANPPVIPPANPPKPPSTEESLAPKIEIEKDGQSTEKANPPAPAVDTASSKAQIDDALNLKTATPVSTDDLKLLQVTIKDKDFALSTSQLMDIDQAIADKKADADGFVKIDSLSDDIYQVYLKPIIKYKLYQVEVRGFKLVNETKITLSGVLPGFISRIDVAASDLQIINSDKNPMSAKDLGDLKTKVQTQKYDLVDVKIQGLDEKVVLREWNYKSNILPRTDYLVGTSAADGVFKVDGGSSWNIFSSSPFQGMTGSISDPGITQTLFDKTKSLDITLEKDGVQFSDLLLTPIERDLNEVKVSQPVQEKDMSPRFLGK